MEVDRPDGDVTKDDVEHAIVVGGTYGNVLADERFGSLPPPVLEADVGRGVDAAHHVISAICEGFNLGIEGARAWTIAVGRHSQADRVVRPVVIVTMPPRVESLLGLVEIVEVSPLEQLEIEGAVKALILAVALRMHWRTVPGCHTVLDQPDAELGERLLGGGAPRAAVVGQDDLGQAIAFKGRLYGVPHGLMLFVVGRVQDHCVARMVVDHGQRMKPALAERNMALEVHLPQSVRLGMLEALPCLLTCRHHRLAMALENLGNGRCRWRRQALPAQACGDLAATPRRVLQTHRKHRRFHLSFRPIRRAVRPPRAVRQAVNPLALEAIQPLVQNPWPHLVLTTQLPTVHPGRQGKTTQLLAALFLALERHRKPHGSTPWECSPCLRTPVHYLSGPYTYDGGGSHEVMRRRADTPSGSSPGPATGRAACPAAWPNWRWRRSNRPGRRSAP